MKNWGKANWDAKREELKNRKWLHELKKENTAGAWGKLRLKIKELVDKHVPEKRRRNRNRPPWLTQAI